MINSLLVCLTLFHVPLWSYHFSVYIVVGIDIHMKTFASAKHTELVCAD